MNLNEPEELVDHTNYKYPESLNVIEIILNLDFIKSFLIDKSSKILDKIFKE